MRLRYLVDTNTLSEPTKLEPDSSILQRLESHSGEYATAAPVWNELCFGSYRLPPSKRRSQLELFLRKLAASEMPILSYDAMAAEWHARERARLSHLGRPASSVDAQIAAVAAVNDLILVTRNTRHFQEFEGLRVEDWAGT